MALESRLDLRLTQKLILTPQLQQVIKLLQMPLLELAQALNQELTENPFLEEAPEDTYAEEFSSEETAQAVSGEDTEAPLENLLNFGVDEYFDERSSDGRDLGYFTTGIEEQPSYDLFYSKKLDLYDHLLWQLRLSSADEETRKTAEAVIGSINEDGYLTATEDELITISGADMRTVLSAITLIQSFDPTGVGSRNLKECLLLQLNAFNIRDTIVGKIVSNNLEDLQKKRYTSIAKQYNSPLDDILTAVKIIEGLEPKPGRGFFSSETNYVVPDVFISRTEEGYQIILNDDGLPRLRLNNTYRSLLLKKEMLSKEDREFLREKLKRAIELMRSLDQRNKTIYKVSDSILKFQRDFFDSGSEHLKPLTLKDVALDINMHESTISRVTSSKYLTCDHGVFSLKFFFSSSIRSGRSGDGEISSTSVKGMIKKLVAEEDTKKPMSDQIIADTLKEQDINIARRTVAKYREELRIPPRDQRKIYE